MNPRAGPGTTPMPGYGLSGYQLEGFGIPGFETNPMIGGGSWEGVTWGGRDASTAAKAWFDAQQPLYPDNTPTPGATYWDGAKGEWVTTGSGGTTSTPAPTFETKGDLAANWVPIVGTSAENGNTIVNYQNTVTGEIVNQIPTGQTTGENYAEGTQSTAPSLQIQPAKPYVTTPFFMSYGGRPAPFFDERSKYPNLSQQIGESMMGITPAPPTFNWAKPAALNASLFGLGHAGLPGWATALGYTLPGAK
jgi:hypothetical protein